ncbi:hypothetical protein L218DRAFT_355836 [Marasmius fiardii PR-910]|nr:hypothetical protein L218DRAFT_355836 [Marasmius fiardii PR-910]
MKDSQSMPFCIHAPTEPEATLIFVVRTSNRDRFWVFLRVLPETPKDEVAQRLKDLADSMHPERIFGDVISPVKCKEALHSLPGLSTSVGNLGVLRAILSYAQVLGINMDTLLASTKAFASNKTAMDGIFNAIVSSAVSSGPKESTTSDVEAGEPVSVASEIPKEESAGTPPPSATERPSRIAAPASASSE